MKDRNLFSDFLILEREMPMDEKQMISVLTNFKEDIIKAFDQRIGIAEENIQHKLDLVVEGQQMLAERMDRMEGRLDGVELRLDRVEVKVDALEMKVDALDAKVDAIAADLTAHRADTEVHHGVCRVKESRE